MIIVEVEIVRDFVGGKDRPWSVRKVVASPPYGPVPPPQWTAADVEQAIRILRPQLILVPDGAELRVTVRPPERPEPQKFKVIEKRYFPKKEITTLVEATSKREATEIVYARVASESKGPTGIDRVSASVHTKDAYFTIEKAREWDLPSSWVDAPSTEKDVA